MIEIYLAGEPVGKGRPRFVKATGRAFTPEKTVRFEDRLSMAAQLAMSGRPLLEGPLKLEMIATRGIPKSWPKKKQDAARAGYLQPTVKPDWDNFGKTCDALNLIVWSDDAQIVDGGVLKFYGDKPGLAIRVSLNPHRSLMPLWAQPYFTLNEGAFE